jgi:hypothetical protein
MKKLTAILVATSLALTARHLSPRRTGVAITAGTGTATTTIIIVAANWVGPAAVLAITGLADRRAAYSNAYYSAGPGL